MGININNLFIMKTFRKLSFNYMAFMVSRLRKRKMFRQLYDSFYKIHIYIQTGIK